MTTDRQRRIALRTAKKMDEAAEALSDFWRECCQGQRDYPDHTVIKLRGDLREYAGWLERRYAKQ